MIYRKNRKADVQAASKTREELESEHGQVWDTAQLAKDFVITAIIGNTVVVRRKADDCVGTLRMQERPRLYYGFEGG